MHARTHARTHTCIFRRPHLEREEEKDQVDTLKLLGVQSGGLAISARAADQQQVRALQFRSLHRANANDERLFRTAVMRFFNLPTHS